MLLKNQYDPCVVFDILFDRLLIASPSERNLEPWVSAFGVMMKKMKKSPFVLSSEGILSDLHHHGCSLLVQLPLLPNSYGIVFVMSSLKEKIGIY